MARSRRSNPLWAACKWVAAGLWHLLSLLAQALWKLLAFLAGLLWQGLAALASAIWKTAASSAGGLSARARHQAQLASRPHAGPIFAPLRAQSTLSGDLAVFEEKFLSSPSSIGLILGARGSGKSALGMRLLENAASRGRKVCAMGFNPSTLPAWMTSVERVQEVPNGALVLVDEGGITFSSRSSMSSANQLLSSLLLVARHKDLSVLFISQNSANLELNAIRQADFLLLRKPSLLQQEFERRRIGQIYSAIASDFSAQPLGGAHSTYVYSDQFRGFVENDLPSFWSARASKSFAGFLAEKRNPPPVRRPISHA